MTVTTEQSSTGPLEGDGSNAAWPFSFPVLDASQLRVIWRHDDTETVLSASDYSVALVNGGRSGGTITYPLGSSRVAADESITIRRSVQYTQPTNLRNQGNLAPETLEALADRMVFQTQQLAEELGRAVTIAESDVGSLTLPSATARASKLLGFDADGDPIAVTAGGDGDYYIDGTYTAPGGVERTIAAKLDDMPSVKDWGAVGDGITDDTAAFQAALQAASALHVPPGTYKLTARLTRTDQGGFALLGAGSQVSRLLWSGGAAGGILLDESGSHSGVNYGVLPRLAVAGLSLLTDAADGGTALHIEMDRGAEPGVLTRDLFISGLDAGADFWTNGIVLMDVVGSFHSELWINGKASVPTSMGSGILIDQAADGGSMVHALDRVTVKWSDRGIKIISRGNLGVEGVAITDALLIGVNIGIDCDASLATGGYRPPYLSLQGAQIDTGPSGGGDPNAKQCVRLVNFAQVFLTNCVFYGDATASTYALVQATGTVDGLIDNCFFIDFAGTSTRAGLFLDDGSARWRINDCNFENLAEAISLENTCSQIDVGVQRFTSCAATVVDPGNVAWRAQRGRTVSGHAAHATGARVNFGVTFAAAPVVTASHRGSDTAINVVVDAIDTSGFTVYHNGAGSQQVVWLAYGEWP